MHVIATEKLQKSERKKKFPLISSNKTVVFSVFISQFYKSNHQLIKYYLLFALTYSEHVREWEQNENARCDIMLGLKHTIYNRSVRRVFGVQYCWPFQNHGHLVQNHSGIHSHRNPKVLTGTTSGAHNGKKYSDSCSKMLSKHKSEMCCRSAHISSKTCILYRGTVYNLFKLLLIEIWIHLKNVHINL